MAQRTTARTHSRPHIQGPTIATRDYVLFTWSVLRTERTPCIVTMPIGFTAPWYASPPRVDPPAIPTRTCAATWTAQQQKTTPRCAAFTSSDDEFSFLSLAQHPYWRRAGRTLHSCNPDHRSRPSLPGVPSSLMDRPGDGCAELPQHNTTNMASGWTCRHRRVHGRTDHPRARISFA